MKADCRVPSGSAVPCHAMLSHDTDLGLPACKVGESSNALNSAAWG